MWKWAKEILIRILLQKNIQRSVVHLKNFRCHLHTRHRIEFMTITEVNAMNICEHLKTQSNKKSSKKYFSSHSKWIDGTFFSLLINQFLTEKKNYGNIRSLQWMQLVYWTTEMQKLCFFFWRTAKMVSEMKNKKKNYYFAETSENPFVCAHTIHTNVFIVENCNKTQFYDYDYLCVCVCVFVCTPDLIPFATVYLYHSRVGSCLMYFVYIKVVC